jgi:hypothetical protein
MNPNSPILFPILTDSTVQVSNDVINILILGAANQAFDIYLVILQPLSQSHLVVSMMTAREHIVQGILSNVSTSTSVTHFGIDRHGERIFSEWLDAIGTDGSTTWPFM